MNSRLQAKLFCVPCILLTTLLAEMVFVVHGYGLFGQSIWFDKIMHTMGGAGSCLLACWITINLPRRWRIVILGVGIPMIGRVAGLFFGMLWEVLEAFFPIITSYIPQGVWDTGFDLVFDYIGGYIAGQVLLWKAGWYYRLFFCHNQSVRVWCAYTNP